LSLTGSTPVQKLVNVIAALVPAILTASASRKAVSLPACCAYPRICVTPFHPNCVSDSPCARIKSATSSASS